MILLDINVISELMRPVPSPKVVGWAVRQNLQDLYTTAINEAELRYGAEILPAGRRRNRLFEEIQGTLEEDFARRILPLDSPAARAYAIIAANRRAAGRPINHSDYQIAVIARSRGIPIATRDIDGFHSCGIEVINPWV